MGLRCFHKFLIQSASYLEGEILGTTKLKSGGLVVKGYHSVVKCLLYEDLSFYAQLMHKSHHGGTEGREETDGLS